MSLLMVRTCVHNTLLITPKNTRLDSFYLISLDILYMLSLTASLMFNKILIEIIPAIKSIY